MGMVTLRFKCRSIFLRDEIDRDLENCDQTIITLDTDSDASVREIEDGLMKKYRFASLYRINIVYNGIVINSALTSRELSFFELQIGMHRGRNASVNFLAIWNIAYPYLDQISTVLGIGGAAIGFGSWIKKRFKDDSKVANYLDLFTSKQCWTVPQFADFLGVDKEEAKHLLKGFGYEWDNTAKVYVKTPRTDEIVKSICKCHYEVDRSGPLSPELNDYYQKLMDESID